LKLTADRHEALHSLFAAAELLVLVSNMGTSYEDKMLLQMLCEMGFGYKAMLQNFLEK